MLPEVFECPDCQRQFVVDSVTGAGEGSIYCPQCKRYLGEKDVEFILRSEIEELVERIRFETDRLERDEALYTAGECDAELRFYGDEVHKVLGILRRALADLEQLKQEYQVTGDR